MSNKQRLQVNNTNLSTVLSEIGGLPLKALVEAAAREGQYVWKKYDKSPTYDTGIIVTQTAAATWKITSNVIDISQIDASFFDGEEFVRSDGWRMRFDTDGTHMTVYDSGGTSKGGGKVTYTNGTMKVTGYGYTYLDTIYDWTAEIIKDQSQTELGYVVNDSESAYPDGGTKDGYWYERVSEGIDLKSIGGFTKIATDEILYSTRTAAGGVLNHSLGAKPTLVLLLPEYPYSNSKLMNWDIISLLACYQENDTISIGQTVAKYDNKPYGSNYIFNRRTKNTLTFSSDLTGYYFAAGVKYTLITMA